MSDYIRRDGGGAADLPWDDLVVSILAVNQYSLEKTFAVVGGLRAAKVTDPASLLLWSVEEMTEKLKAAGCDRGTFMTTLFAQRLGALGELIRNKGVAQCEAVLSSGDRHSIETKGACIRFEIQSIRPTKVIWQCALRCDCQWLGDQPRSLCLLTRESTHERCLRQAGRFVSHSIP